jgi:hypothetical protein
LIDQRVPAPILQRLSSTARAPDFDSPSDHCDRAAPVSISNEQASPFQ